MRLLITGDFCPIGRNNERIKENDTTLLGEISKHISKADLAITNLEAPITSSSNRIKKTGPNLKADLKTALFLKKSGFNLLMTANNDILDYGSEGIIGIIG